MHVLSSLFEYNRWCNARVLATCAAAPPDVLARPMDGLFENVLRTAQHLAQVEAVYLGFVGGGAIEADWLALPIDGVHQEMDRIDLAYLSFVEGATDSVLERRFYVPWFEREFRVGDGLLQVITHSCEHRADIGSALARVGVATPPIDYVVGLMA